MRELKRFTIWFDRGCVSCLDLVRSERSLETKPVPYYSERKCGRGVRECAIVCVWNDRLKSIDSQKVEVQVLPSARALI